MQTIDKITVAGNEPFVRYSEGDYRARFIWTVQRGPAGKPFSFHESKADAVARAYGGGRFSGDVSIVVEERSGELRRIQITR